MGIRPQQGYSETLPGIFGVGGEGKRKWGRRTVARERKWEEEGKERLSFWWKNWEIVGLAATHALYRELGSLRPCCSHTVLAQDLGTQEPRHPM